MAIRTTRMRHMEGTTVTGHCMWVVLMSMPSKAKEKEQGKAKVMASVIIKGKKGTSPEIVRIPLKGKAKER